MEREMHHPVLGEEKESSPIFISAPSRHTLAGSHWAVGKKSCALCTFGSTYYE